MRIGLALATHLAFALLIAAAAGCGSRSSLRVDFDAGAAEDAEMPIDAPIDAPMDAGRDGGTDAGPDELSVDCGRRERFTSPRRPIVLEATVTSERTITSEGWTLVSAPPETFPAVMRGPGPMQATLTPSGEGEHLMRFEAVDDLGRVGSCEVIVRSVVGPPVAICPEEGLVTGVDMPVEVVGDGFDDEEVVAFRWEVVTAPAGATPVLSSPETPVTSFSADVRGRYLLRLTVVDADMATDSCDVEVIVTGPPLVTCPPDEILAPTRQRRSISASATHEIGIESERWELVVRPPTSSATLSPTTGSSTAITPDRRGEYLVRYTATAIGGASASCEITVIGTPTPPTVTCPDRVETGPLTAVSITATAVDDGMIVGWRWERILRPVGSDAGQPSPGNQPTTSFLPDIAGEYVLRVTATDDDGMTGTCETEVAAVNVDGLRIEMFWNTNGTDMDVHLLRPGGARWFSADDCYYANCVGGLQWGGPGPEDNPRLDIDNTSGFGPENINIEAPFSGTYVVGVHNWRGGGQLTQVTVRVYCGGSTTEPRETYGPVTLRDRSGGNDFWRVVDVDIRDFGACTLRERTGPGGGPDIITGDQARAMP